MNRDSCRDDGTRHLAFSQHPIEAIRRRGSFHRQQWAHALLDEGDTQDCLAWVRIAKAITNLEREAAGKGDRVQ